MGTRVGRDRQLALGIDGCGCTGRNRACGGRSGDRGLQVGDGVTRCGSKAKGLGGRCVAYRCDRAGRQRRSEAEWSGGGSIGRGVGG
jgi:hypothetical protein